MYKTWPAWCNSFWHSFTNLHLQRRTVTASRAWHSFLIYQALLIGPRLIHKRYEQGQVSMLVALVKVGFQSWTWSSRRTKWEDFSCAPHSIGTLVKSSLVRLRRYRCLSGSKVRNVFSIAWLSEMREKSEDRNLGSVQGPSS